MERVLEIDASVEPALAAWLRKHERGLWRYLRLLGCKPDEAEDFCQDALLAGIAQQRRSGKAPSAAWLRTAARNFYWMELRRQSRRPDLRSLGDVDAVYERHAGDDGGDRYQEALHACLESLSPRSRLALELRYAEGCGREAIAARVGIGQHGVKSLLQRLRRTLQDCIQKRVSQDD